MKFSLIVGVTKSWCLIPLLPLHGLSNSHHEENLFYFIKVTFLQECPTQKFFQGVGCCYAKNECSVINIIRKTVTPARKLNMLLYCGNLQSVSTMNNEDGNTTQHFLILLEYINLFLSLSRALLFFYYQLNKRQLHQQNAGGGEVPICFSRDFFLV